MQKSDIGLIGLGVMGENLALNMDENGFKVSLYNREHPGKENPVDTFLKAGGSGKNFEPAYTLEAFTASLKSPRTVMLMIKAGKPVDDVIAQVLPHLSAGDIIIDGGNSDFEDTQRRVDTLSKSGVLFVGAGISGGESGARRGPSIMAGGNPKAWPVVSAILQKIAAKLENGETCCQWVGDGGAGHFVKMVHNGIEYGDMQLIAESYDILKTRIGLTNDETAKIFEAWNKGDLDSYLIEITAKVLAKKDDKGGSLVDYILDAAGQKGTGKLTVKNALELGTPLGLIAQSVFARFLSDFVTRRKKASEIFADAKPKSDVSSAPLIGDIENALYVSKVMSYAQGFSLLRAASANFAWHLNYAAIAKIWRKGCIIRSVFLNDIAAAYQKNPDLESLLFDDYFKSKIVAKLPSLRKIVADAALCGLPLACMSAALSYFDGLCQKRSSANLLQAQRDFFGSHTYERIDTPRGQFFHTHWE